MTTRMPSLFIPHGGGPCFFMDGFGPPGAWDAMAAYLRGIAGTLPERPTALLIVSGHWEAARPTLTSNPKPELIYDYHGFPPHTYALRYPAPGEPALAARSRRLLGEAGLDGDLDAGRGWDHGVFIPMKLSFPAADIPIVQLSLLHSRDARAHLALGAALEPLRDEGVLVIGSGMSYHNMLGFFSGSATDARASADFDAWLTEAVCAPDPQRRSMALADWAAAPSARACHPEEEHLLPLMVAAGAGGDDSGCVDFHDRSLGVTLSAFRFG